MSVDLLEAYYAVSNHLREQAEQQLAIAERLARYADQIGEARIAEHSQRNAPAAAQERPSGAQEGGQ